MREKEGYERDRGIYEKERGGTEREVIELVLMQLRVTVRERVGGHMGLV